TQNDLILYASEINDKGNNTPTILGYVESEGMVVEDLGVTYTFPESLVGNQVFASLVVFDGNNSDEDTIVINVTDDYTPRLKQKLPDVDLEEGETKYNVFDLDDYFDDPDADSLFYSFGESHVSVIINEDHTVDISSVTDWNGMEVVTFRARDPIGALAEDSIIVTVKPINDPPVISGVPETFIIHHDVDYLFDLTPYVSDKDNDIKDLFLILADDHIRTPPLNPLQIIMNYPRSMLDMDVPVKLVVSDGIDTASQDITVRVTENWPPAIRYPLPDVTYYEDSVFKNYFNLNDYFLDKDSNTLFYTYGQKNVTIVINQDGSVDFSAIKDWYGVELVTFRASDSTLAFVEDIIRVTVIPVNDPPVIQELPVQNGRVKQLMKFDLTEFISDVDNNLSELKLTVDSDKIEIMISGWELMVYSEEALVEEVTLTVSDGQEEVSKTLLYDIKAEEEKEPDMFKAIMSILWLIILLIIIIISISGYAMYRRYVGDYKIEEVFWVHNDGILIYHISPKKSNRGKDREIVSSMLTGIINFAQEAFSDEGGDKRAWGIKEIQMNEKNILVDRSDHTFLAVVFSGRSGKRLYLQSGKVLTTIEKKYKRTLKKWDGDVGKFKGAQRIIKSILISDTHKKNN
ncbi:hypothetical protein, partial [[Eubacterium] cellulosolvens]